MPPRNSKNIIVISLCTVLVFAACTKPDRSNEATALSNELQDSAVSDMDKALERVDSAEEAGVFTTAHANTVKACIYENADRRRMATYYAEKAIAAEAGHAITTCADSSDYCATRWILADNACDNGEYGKSLALAREVLAFVGNGTSPQSLAMKCRALSEMADCESELNHISEAEQQLYRRLCTLMTDQQPYTDETLNRDTLAQLLGTNAKYVVQAIRECSHGETVMDFINRYRLENVAYLLKTTDDPIALIGELSGIPNRVTLSRLFRSAYGMTCREYRLVARAERILEE